MTTHAAAHDLDGPERFEALRQTIVRKGGLRRIYRDTYLRYRECLERCRDVPGEVLELGSGGGFAQEIIPGLVTSDVIPYSGVDRVIDGTRMPFADGTLRAILMFNVFHHIPDVEAFLQEATRCLAPGGRLLIVDQYPGWISHWILKYAHHEGYDPGARSWKFASTGPLSSANGALAWIVFFRDRARFETLFPRLRVEGLRPHSPLRYWLSGGLKEWSLLPAWLYPALAFCERLAVRALPRLASFIDIELVKRER